MPGVPPSIGARKSVGLHADARPWLAPPETHTRTYWVPGGASPVSHSARLRRIPRTTPVFTVYETREMSTFPLTPLLPHAII